jgi:division protein CdvB (Snf7/Vps24/ESCRT-III family)
MVKPLNMIIKEISDRLRKQMAKVESNLQVIDKHDRELSQKAVELLKQRDYARASLYANESFQVRLLLERIVKAKAMIEFTDSKLNSIQSIEEAQIELPITDKILESIRKELGAIIPEVSYEISRIQEQIREILNRIWTPIEIEVN